MTRRLFLLAAVAAAPYAEDFTGKVVAITDGDTIKVTHNGAAERIRLWGIDCPEMKQAFGTRAKQFTGDLAFRSACDGEGPRHRPVQAYGRRDHPSRWPKLEPGACSRRHGGISSTRAAMCRCLCWSSRPRRRSEGCRAIPRPMATWEWRKVASSRRNP